MNRSTTAWLSRCAFLGLIVSNTLPLLAQEPKPDPATEMAPAIELAPEVEPGPEIEPTPGAEPGVVLRHPQEVHFGEVRQLTFEGENAEAYWSPDGKDLIMQATFPPHECDQIFRVDPNKPGELEMVSTGKGRTTCAFYHADGERILYASTHEADAACPPKPGFSQGYVWPLYPGYELYSAKPDGTDLVALTDNDVYDAEATVCRTDGSIVFTSTRDGDLDLYRMDADGSNVKRLTEAPGYDGGAFFSHDCEKIVWRASRPKAGEALDDYQRLLGENLVRPGKLELWVANADGSEAQQITYLDAASFAPYFYPEGDRVLFSTNYGDPKGREFDIWAVNVDGTKLERITFSPGFDGFPMFSPDGRYLAFASNRNQAKDGDTNVFVTQWLPGTAPVADVKGEADRLMAAVEWLASDDREGRGLGTNGLAQATSWLVFQMAAAGIEAGIDGDFRQAFDVPIRVTATDATSLRINEVAIAAASAGQAEDGSDAVPGYGVASYASAGSVEGEIVPVGYGISAPDLEHDDYQGRDVTDKIVLVRRFVPAGDTFSDSQVSRRYGDLRYKAFTAREHGAAGVLIVDLPEVGEGEAMPDEAPLPRLRVDTRGDAGLPVMVLSRAVGAPLFEGSHRASMTVELDIEHEATHNVVGKISAGEGALPGAVVIGAHFDHLGMGGAGSLAPEANEPHNGADDNASGTAALLEIARAVKARQSELKRDLYLVAFSAEESGLRGSTHFTQNPPSGVTMDDVVTMVNLDMIGRLRNNRVSALGAASAEEWAEILPPLCEQARIGCALGGDGFGPSDQTPFYAAGVPVLHFFTGAHDDYHKPSDDAELLNAAGAARIAALTADVALAVAAREEGLTYQAAKAPEPRGDARSFGASLGTIPDYATDGVVGVKLAGTRPGGPAEQAGFLRGDVLVELAGREVRDIHDFMFVLRQSKPGETVSAVVEREGERVELEVTFGKSRGMR
ncbi:MAG: M20/M25/M40 family metallo-hydrolase [Acidobacteriota bacterium]